MKKCPLTSEGKSIINDVDGALTVTVKTGTNNIGGKNIINDVDGALTVTVTTGTNNVGGKKYH